MILSEIQRECADALQELSLTAVSIPVSEELGGGEIIRFYDKRGHELLISVEVDANADRLSECDAYFYDLVERQTKAGDVFHFKKNPGNVQVDTYDRMRNILWANRYFSKPGATEGVHIYDDEDMFNLIEELDRSNIDNVLEIRGFRPRLSIRIDGEEVSSARKSAGRLRYQNTEGVVVACPGVDAATVKEFVGTILKDIDLTSEK